ncbi:uncharacterized protein N7482_003128 [Penicillium canariense]|uniref:Uncharacterized protein n=1 Tax=Penicillium canariense TaxID=189055 RepID=A0A9W9IMY9_9EURO|nr:uncharacterized protein N7482_003128 [Penicillium canariense]KAJ5177251.1 hypothetical protein N7482_003128 [Penicillium canariense]
MPPPAPVNHRELRARYRASVTNMLTQLRTFSQWTFKVDDLAALGVDVCEFDPYDLRDCTPIFEPLSEQELDDYDLDEDLVLNEEILEKLNLQDWAPSTSNEISRREEEMEAMRAGGRIFEYLEARYSCWSMIYQPKTPLSMVRNWTDVAIPHPEYTWPRSLGINSWPRDHGLLSRPRTRDHVGWRCEMVGEWKDRPRRGDPTTRPHVRLIIVHGTIGSSNGILLGELGALAQVIYNRLCQPSFDHESFFPVLLISLFGPRHGRILQGVYRRNGKLDLRVSRVYSFVKVKEAPLDLFLRYLASTPRRDDC